MDQGARGRRTERKLDFAICTHTLEDLDNPGPVWELLPVVARRAFVAVPSKHAELRRHAARGPAGSTTAG